MTIKKSLVALGTAATVAIAGTGIANAADAPDTPPTQGSADLSANRDVFGSITGADALGSYTDGQIDVEKSFTALAVLAAGAGSIAGIAKAYDAVVSASDTFQGVVSDTQAFLESQGIL